MQQKDYKELFFTDDFLFCKIMTHDKSICKRVIETLLGIEVESFTYINQQQELRADSGSHGVRLDVMAKDAGRTFDLEMQTTSRKDLPLRARYYQAVIDVDTLGKNRPYSDLPSSYIVFICTSDPFGGGLPRYTAKTVCLENRAFDQKVDDKILKVYYNASCWAKAEEVDEKARAFLRFITTREPTDKLTEDIMEAVESARGYEPWRIEFLHMRELREDGYNEGYDEGREDGIAEGRAEGIKTGIAQGLEQGISQGRAEAQAEISELKAASQARIAELEAELAKYKGKDN